MKGENNPMYGRTGENCPNFGKHHTDEIKNKISETLKGHTVSEETRRNMSEAQKGRTLSEETRKKISESMKRRCAAKKNLKKDIT